MKKSPILRPVGTIVFAVGILVGRVSGGAVPQYALVDLGTFGGSYSQAKGINNNGQVVGDAQISNGQYHAFMYSGGSMHDLGTLGGNYSFGSGINASGQIVGFSATSAGNDRAFLYSNGVMRSLGTLSGGSYANGINDQGQVVGYYLTAGSGFKAFLYSNGSIQNLGGFNGNSEAQGINALGQAVGYFYTNANAYHAFICLNNSVQDLGTLGGTNSQALGINSSGQVVGFAELSNTYDPFLYSSGILNDLGVLNGSSGEAFGINNLGQVVGYFNTGKGSTAFVYCGGTMYDLNSLLFNKNSGWFLESANALNDVGQIVGEGINPSGQPHAFLLNPLPDGATTAPANTQTSTPVYGHPPVKDPSGDGLVVITHGWTPKTKTTDPVAYTAWVDGVSNQVVQRLSGDGVTGWQVFGYRWAQGSYTPLPDAALNDAKQEGVGLGLSIVSQGWTKVHLIAHSAGAALIEECAEVIKKHAPGTIVQCTFLDPYMGSDGSGYGHYGKAADWSDSYFSRDAETGSRTEGSLVNAYNIDVTQLDTDDQVKLNYFVSGEGFEQCSKTESTHSWPVSFYSNSIVGAVTSDYQNFGYKLSQEGGLFSVAETTYHEGNNPAQVLGNPDPPCSQSVWYVGVDIANYLKDLRAEVYYSASGIINPLGNGAYQLFDPLGAPVWLGMVVTPTNAENVVSFDAEFTDAEGSHGLVSVYWDTNMIGLVDEAAVQPGLNHFSLAIPMAFSETSHVLGFHLDPFTDVQSIVIVTNIALEAHGVTQPPVLSVTTNPDNGLLVYQLTGQPDQYVIQASTNLVSTNWTNIAIAANTNGVVDFVDPDSTNYPVRLYRAVSQ